MLKLFRLKCISSLVVLVFTWTLVLLLANACSGRPRVESILACTQNVTQDNFDDGSENDLPQFFAGVENEEMLDRECWKYWKEKMRKYWTGMAFPAGATAVRWQIYQKPLTSLVARRKKSQCRFRGGNVD